MNRALFLSVALAAFACGPAPGPDAPAPHGGASATPAPAPTTAPAATATTAEQAARQFFEAMVAGDLDGMRKLTLTHAELASASHKAPPRDEYDQAVDGFLKDLVREMKEAPSKPAVASVTLEKAETLRAADSEKLVHDLDVAIVRVVLRVGGEERQGPGFLFVRTESGFKLSIKN